MMEFDLKMLKPWHDQTRLLSNLNRSTKKFMVPIGKF